MTDSTKAGVDHFHRFARPEEVDLLVTDIVGKQFPKLSVTLLQDGDEPPKGLDGVPVGGYAEWMPYQVGQAKKEGVQ